MSESETASFGAAASRWFSLASRLLGWRPVEFWQATPTELSGALRDPDASNSTAPPSRDQIAQMLERDRHG